MCVSVNIFSRGQVQPQQRSLRRDSLPAAAMSACNADRDCPAPAAAARSSDGHARVDIGIGQRLQQRIRRDRRAWPAAAAWRARPCAAAVHRKCRERARHRNACRAGLSVASTCTAVLLVQRLEQRGHAPPAGAGAAARWSQRSSPMLHQCAADVRAGHECSRRRAGSSASGTVRVTMRSRWRGARSVAMRCQSAQALVAPRGRRVHAQQVHAAQQEGHEAHVELGATGQTDGGDTALPCACCAAACPARRRPHCRWRRPSARAPVAGRRVVERAARRWRPAALSSGAASCLRVKATTS